MNVLVGAQLPRRLARSLSAIGYDAVHTFDLPNGNRTTDAEINALSVREQRVVITKDEDFVSSFLLNLRPFKLLLVSTGNIDNDELVALFATNLVLIAAAFEQHDYIELT